MGSFSIVDDIFEFITELVKSLKDGYLFFGSKWDLIRYAADIIIVSFLLYWTLLFIRQTRAWQLIKGIILILMFVVVCGLFGLDMVGFLFNKLLYVFAILFIVIFQPELRRALETVGIRSFGSVKSLLASDEADDKTAATSLVNEICLACREMSRTYTGALILIERSTRLEELLEQENVVKFDSTVTNSVLQSIFYKGSPMHDGGLLIRNGRIIAARCHVPLAVTMHTLDRTGTRHRAAVGASEMGDTVAVVVSEERGKTSIAVNGRLYEMRNSQELEANLMYLLGLSEEEETKKGVAKVLSRFKRHKSKQNAVAPVVEKTAVPVTEAAGEEAVVTDLKVREEHMADKARTASFGTRVLIMIASILISIGLWMYIQVNTNPVITKELDVPITYGESDWPDNLSVSYPIDEVRVKIVGRQDTIEDITASDIIARIDYSGVSNVGVVELPITIRSAGSDVYFRVERQIPETASVTVYASEIPEDDAG